MAAKKVVRKESAAVAVNVTKGDRLLYTVAVRGPMPGFALVDSQSQKVLLSSNDLDSTGKAQRFWPLPIDSVSGGTQHVLALNFLDAIQYTYTVEYVPASGPRLLTDDVDYQSTQHEPAMSQGLSVYPY